MIFYEDMAAGTFRARPNRFIAHVEIQGKVEICHVKNTGRCKELLVPGATVWCQHHHDPGRKTAWSLIAVEKGKRLINMDSQVPNRAAFDYVSQGGLGFVPQMVKAEQTYGNSRFDLYFEADGRKGFVEVKGVTLEQDGIARFPDAPTQRGCKHLRELARAAEEGYEAWVLFVIQMDEIACFEPNEATDPDFAQALREASRAGVHIKAVTCTLTPQTMTITGEVPASI